MTIPRTAKKGLGSIRTNMDRAFRGMPVHKAYLKIGSIEMEKDRRMSEKRALLARLAELDARCRELDAEKLRLLVLSGQGKPVAATAGQDTPLPSAPHPKPRAPKTDLPEEKSPAAPVMARAPENRVPENRAPARRKRQAVSGSPGRLNFKY